MSIDDAITAYARLGEEIFGQTKWVWKEGRYKASNLERAIQRIVGEAQNEAARNDRSDGVTKKGVLRKLVPKILDKHAQAQKKVDKTSEESGKSVMLRDDRENSCKTYVPPQVYLLCLTGHCTVLYAR